MDFLQVWARKSRSEYLLFSTEIEADVTANLALFSRKKYCTEIKAAHAQKTRHRKRDSLLVEISLILSVKWMSYFFQKLNKNSLSLSDWFFPSRFFQGHWPKILVFCVLNGMLIFYLLSLKKISYSSVLSLKIFVYFQHFNFLRMS